MLVARNTRHLCEVGTKRLKKPWGLGGWEGLCLFSYNFEILKDIERILDFLYFFKKGSSPVRIALFECWHAKDGT